MVDLTKLSDDELRSIASGNLKDLPEETLRLISGATAPAGSAPPIGMAAAPAIEEKFDKDFEEKKAQIKRDQEAKAQEITTTSPFTLPGLLTSPTAVVTGAGLLALGTGYVAGRYGPEIADKAKGAYKSIKERFISNPVEAPVRIEPIGFESFADMTPVDQPSAQALDNLRRAEELAEANRQLGIGNQPVAPGPIARNALPMGAVNPAMFSSSPKAPVFDTPPATPFSSAPPGAPAPESSAGPNSSTTSIVNNTVKEMIDEVDKSPQELRTGTGKPAFAGMGPEASLNKKGEPKLKVDYASVADVPAGFAFVPGAQYIDTPRQNLGQLEYTKAYTDRPFPLTNEQAIQESKDINKLLGRATRAEAKAAGLPPAELTPGITKKTSAGTKPVRVAGTVGALMAISDLAKAETPGQRGMAGANVLEAVLPPGFMMGSAGQGSSNVPSFEQAVLLGSPYAQTEFAKKKRQEQEYSRKVNRAVPPPFMR